jgi:hypothetical protein
MAAFETEKKMRLQHCDPAGVVLSNLRAFLPSA